MNKPLVKFVLMISFWIGGGSVAMTQYYVVDSTESEITRPIKEVRVKMDRLVALYGPFAAVNVSVAQRTKELRDSLLAAGIDSLLVVEKADNQYWRGLQLARVKGRHLERTNLRPIASANPSYLFWADRGHFFVRKLDQFGEYPTLERPYHTHVTFYDYHRLHQEGLTADTLLKVFAKSPFGEHELYDYRSEGLNPFPEPTSIQFTAVIGKTIFQQNFDQREFQPQGHSADDQSNPKIANNLLNYGHNQDLKSLHWLLLIDREIAMIEALGLWRQAVR